MTLPPPPLPTNPKCKMDPRLSPLSPVESSPLEAVSQPGGIRYQRSCSSLSHDSGEYAGQEGFELYNKFRRMSGVFAGDNYEDEEEPINRTQSMMTDFIKVQAQVDIAADAPFARSRLAMTSVLASTPVQLAMSIIVVVDFIVSCIDTDARARGEMSPYWIDSAMGVFFSIYCIEFSMNLWIRRSRIFKGNWERLDFFVLAAGSLEYILADLATGPGLSNTRVLRVLRMTRMLRVVRRFGKVKELKRLLQMMASCSRTLIWSFAFCFLVTTVWACISVEIIHPIVEELAESNRWQDCDDCKRSFSSVMRANLTLFKTVIAGDSWGIIAVPVMEAYPATGLIFMGSHLSVIYGVLNLALAVVVDSFAESREHDEKQRALDLDEAQAEDEVFLTRVFRSIDEDESGEVTLEELLDGAKMNADFASRLRIMDIDASDLTQLFFMLDEDRSGAIELSEFVTALSRWRYESKTASRFVKHNLMVSLQRTEELKSFVAEQIKMLQESLQHSSTISNGGKGKSTSNVNTKVHLRREAMYGTGASGPSTSRQTSAASGQTSGPSTFQCNGEQQSREVINSQIDQLSASVSELQIELQMDSMLDSMSFALDDLAQKANESFTTGSTQHHVGKCLPVHEMTEHVKRTETDLQEAKSSGSAVLALDGDVEEEPRTSVTPSSISDNDPYLRHSDSGKAFSEWVV